MECTLRVQYLGLAKNIVGKDEEHVTAPAGTSVRSLLNSLIARHGADLEALLFAGQGTLRSNVRVVLEQRDLHDGKSLDTPLQGTEQSLLLVVVNPIMGA